MESCRNPTATKLKVGLPHQVIQTEKNNFTEDEKKIIGELKQLYLETIKLDVKMQREVYNMEKQYEVKHNEIFEKRKKILDDFKKQNHGDSTRNENVSTFWLKVLKASYTEFIGKEDERILSFLSDIRTKHYNDDIVKFVIEFHFDKNDYFKNRVLTKTYFLNCVPEADDPLSFDGAEIVRCEGCNIDWKQSLNRDKKDQPTFFDFFSPPTLPDDPEDPNFCDINAILQNDFELGFYLKERVIPKAIIFFTGEIADCQSTDGSETTESDSEDESDVDGEEESSTNGNK